MTTCNEQDDNLIVELDDKLLCEINNLLVKFNFSNLGDIQHATFLGSKRSLRMQLAASSTITVNGYKYQLRRENDGCWLYENESGLYRANRSFTYWGPNTPLRGYSFVLDDTGEKCKLFDAQQLADGSSWGDIPILSL